MAYPLIVLLLLDLVYLLHQLPHSQLQLSQFVLGCYLCVVVGVLPNLNVQVNPLKDNILVSEPSKRHNM